MILRKSVGLSQELWAAIDDYRFSHRIASEAKTIRLLLAKALGKRPTAQYNFQAKLKRKERSDARR